MTMIDVLDIANTGTSGLYLSGYDYFKAGLKPSKQFLLMSVGAGEKHTEMHAHIHMYATSSSYNCEEKWNVLGILC